MRKIVDRFFGNSVCDSVIINGVGYLNDGLRKLEV